MTKSYLGIVPFWPLNTHIKQNYFLTPAKIASKLGFSAQLIIPSTHHTTESIENITITHSPDINSTLAQLPPGSILHFHTTYRSILKSIFRQALSGKQLHSLWTPHTAYSSNFQLTTTLSHSIINILAHTIDHLLCISPYETDYFHNRNLKQAVYLPLCIHQSPKTPPKVFNNHGLIFFGGDRPVKGLSGVLQAHSTLSTLGIDLELHVLNVVSSQFKQQHRSFINKHVTFHGYINPSSQKFRKIYNQTTIYINNSVQEGTPLAAYETAASHHAMCLSNLPTLKSIFSTNALYHSHPSQLVNNLLLYLHNPDLFTSHRRQLIQLSKQFQLKQFKTSFAQIIKPYL